MGEPASDWWRFWFGPGYLALYDDTLRERTPIEIDQLEALLQLRPPLRILDLPCGQGRHAIELARRRPGLRPAASRFAGWRATCAGRFRARGLTWSSISSPALAISSMRRMIGWWSRPRRTCSGPEGDFSWRSSTASGSCATLSSANGSRWGRRRSWNGDRSTDPPVA